MGRGFARFMAEKGWGLILVDMKYDRLRATEIYLQDNVKCQLFIKMIVVKPTGQNEAEISDQIS